MDITATPIGNSVVTCRTCVHGNHRYWNRTLAEVKEVAKDKEALAALQCHPTEVEVSLKVRRDGVLIPLSDGDRGLSARAIDPQMDPYEPLFVDSCGFRLAPKCRNCARLNTVALQVPHDRFPGSKADVVIMASCSIPAEGIMFQGKRVTCAPKKISRVTNIVPSCENCKFRMTTDENWQLHEFAVNAMDLTPWEMEQVRLGAGGRGPQVGGAINRAREALWSSPTGRRRWYGVTIVAELPGLVRVTIVKTLQHITLHLDGGDIVGYTAHRFDGDRYIRLESEQMTLVRTEDATKASLVISLPRQAPLGLVDGPGGNDGTHKRVPVFPPLPEIVGARYWTRPRTRTQPAERVRIWPKHQDYFAAKRPVYNPISETIDFTRPTGAAVDNDDDWQYSLTVVKDEGRWRVVDGRWDSRVILAGLWACFGLGTPDLEPHVTVFELRLRSLRAMAQSHGGKAAVADIDAQYRAAVATLPRSRSIPTNPGFFRTLNLEPFKEYCSLNLADPTRGIDFRDLFGDTFGMDRTSFSFTWTHKMEADEWYRATQAGNEAQGEIMRTEMLDPAWPGRSASDPDKWEALRAAAKVIQLDTFGHRIDLDGDEEITAADRKADIEAYLEFLDERIARTNDDGHPVWEDRRMQLHGYTTYRGSRVEKVPNIVMSQDGDDVEGHLLCPGCGAVYPLTMLNDPDQYLPVLTCPACGDYLRVARRKELDTWVRMGKRVGIGTAVAADSESYQNRQRLRSTVCESWRFRPNPNITFNMVVPGTGPGPFRPDLDKALQDQLDAELIGIDTSFVSGSTTGGWRPSS